MTVDADHHPIDPPIRCITPSGVGLIVARSSDDKEYTVKLKSGETIRVDGANRGQVYKDKFGLLIKFLPQ